MVRLCRFLNSKALQQVYGLPCGLAGHDLMAQKVVLVHQPLVPIDHTDAKNNRVNASIFRVFYVEQTRNEMNMKSSIQGLQVEAAEDTSTPEVQKFLTCSKVAGTPLVINDLDLLWRPLAVRLHTSEPGQGKERRTARGQGTLESPAGQDRARARSARWSRVVLGLLEAARCLPAFRHLAAHAVLWYPGCPARPGLLNRGGRTPVFTGRLPITPAELQ